MFRDQMPAYPRRSVLTKAGTLQEDWSRGTPPARRPTDEKLIAGYARRGHCIAVADVGSIPTVSTSGRHSERVQRVANLLIQSLVERWARRRVVLDLSTRSAAGEWLEHFRAEGRLDHPYLRNDGAGLDLSIGDELLDGDIVIHGAIVSVDWGGRASMPVEFKVAGDYAEVRLAEAPLFVVSDDDATATLLAGTGVDALRLRVHCSDAGSHLGSSTR